ncbi:hypothetical protein OTSTA716_1324 [Orientia tsutsugamushi str. TA716]|uniref:Uncharacterized protein n=1 Tax=Orientia tsutsugamushi str. TA716 TaxID=1359175 RepID=A0A0F3NUN0_ORITS|nr:hypothetical protein OTSTA716_2681 [Orientia tsutsugamushi str. TA716]KJV71785.1 hypothetical protein OTSTA716_2147 [Orientia tsutsugamushi str. TA716]KJV74312.1 hypothetical protein OTSTA716_1324 [Orientia tsutsugamushi str. TA716]
MVVSTALVSLVISGSIMSLIDWSQQLCNRLLKSPFSGGLTIQVIAPFISNVFAALITVLLVIEFLLSLSAAMMIFSPGNGE